MSYIFINALGISTLLARILAAAGSVDYLLFACLAYFVIERYGRRRVMMCSAAACSICWIVVSPRPLHIIRSGANKVSRSPSPWLGPMPAETHTFLALSAWLSSSFSLRPSAVECSVYHGESTSENPKSRQHF